MALLNPAPSSPSGTFRHPFSRAATRPRPWPLELCREGVQEAAREELGYFIRSGIVVVLRNQTIPSGTVI